MATPLYIFDLDGTLALNGQREHFLADTSDPDRWDKFFMACGTDIPNIPVINTMIQLRESGADVWIFSGRSDITLEMTTEWLLTHTGFPAPQRMRQGGDYTPDDELKSQWLEEMTIEDRNRLVAVFDDRNKVVEMWRSKGVPCFQVAVGDF